MLVRVRLKRSLSFGCQVVQLHTDNEPRRRRACRQAVAVLDRVAENLSQALGRLWAMGIVQPLHRDEVHLSARPSSLPRCL